MRFSATLKIHEQEVEDIEGRCYLMRIQPYRTGDNRIDGAVLRVNRYHGPETRDR